MWRFFQEKNEQLLQTGPRQQHQDGPGCRWAPAENSYQVFWGESESLEHGFFLNQLFAKKTSSPFFIRTHGLESYEALFVLARRVFFLNWIRAIEPHLWPILHACMHTNSVSYDLRKKEKNPRETLLVSNAANGYFPKLQLTRSFGGLSRPWDKIRAGATECLRRLFWFQRGDGSETRSRRRTSRAARVCRTCRPTARPWPTTTRPPAPWSWTVSRKTAFYVFLEKLETWFTKKTKILSKLNSQEENQNVLFLGPQPEVLTCPSCLVNVKTIVVRVPMSRMDVPKFLVYMLWWVFLEWKSESSMVLNSSTFFCLFTVASSRFSATAVGGRWRNTTARSVSASLASTNDPSDDRTRFWRYELLFDSWLSLEFAIDWCRGVDKLYGNNCWRSLNEDIDCLKS